MKRKIAIAITGASGSIYARILLDKMVALRSQIADIGVVMSTNARDVWKHELGNTAYEDYELPFFDKHDFSAPFASGSAGFDTLIVCPCSMGTLGRIASGVSNDLITRAADVMLKERRRLILVARETPYSLIHINNMKIITEAGGIICPATPSFYSMPKTVDDVAATVISRVIDLAGLEDNSFRWGTDK